MSVWCDNCLLLFPLRGGAMALALFIALYSIAGSIFLFMRGQFFYFMTYEADVYGGIGMAVGFLALLNLVGLANQSYMWNRVMFYVSPLLLLLCAIRAGLMVFRLNYYQSDVAWECKHGGELYNSTLANETYYYGNGTTGATVIPTYFCTYGWNTVYLAFAFSVAIDCIIQVYSWFLTWRYKALLENQYFGLNGQKGGIYTA